jgi:hypothetical protein
LALPLALTAACASPAAQSAGEGPIEVGTLSCSSGQQVGSILDYSSEGDGIPDAALPSELDRLSARYLADRWSEARLSVAFEDAEHLDAVADTASGRMAIYRFDRPPHGEGWRLTSTSSCSS